jgi:hypothetical protein
MRIRLCCYVVLRPLEAAEKGHFLQGEVWIANTGIAGASDLICSDDVAGHRLQRADVM